MALSFGLSGGRLKVFLSLLQTAAKQSDAFFFEATEAALQLRALNPSKSTHLLITIPSSDFDGYRCESPPNEGGSEVPPLTYLLSSRALTATVLRHTSAVLTRLRVSVGAVAAGDPDVFVCDRPQDTDPFASLPPIQPPLSRASSDTMEWEFVHPAGISKVYVLRLSTGQPEFAYAPPNLFRFEATAVAKMWGSFFTCFSKGTHRVVVQPHPERVSFWAIDDVGSTDVEYDPAAEVAAAVSSAAASAQTGVSLSTGTPGAPSRRGTGASRSEALAAASIVSHDSELCSGGVIGVSGGLTAASASADRFFVFRYEGLQDESGVCDADGVYPSGPGKRGRPDHSGLGQLPGKIIETQPLKLFCMICDQLSLRVKVCTGGYGLPVYVEAVPRGAEDAAVPQQPQRPPARLSAMFTGANSARASDGANDVAITTANMSTVWSMINHPGPPSALDGGVSTADGSLLNPQLSLYIAAYDVTPTSTMVAPDAEASSPTKRRSTGVAGASTSARKSLGNAEWAHQGQSTPLQSLRNASQAPSTLVVGTAPHSGAVSQVSRSGDVTNGPGAQESFVEASAMSAESQRSVVPVGTVLAVGTQHVLTGIEGSTLSSAHTLSAQPTPSGSMRRGHHGHVISGVPTQASVAEGLYEVVDHHPTAATFVAGSPESLTAIDGMASASGGTSTCHDGVPVAATAASNVVQGFPHRCEGPEGSGGANIEDRRVSRTRADPNPPTGAPEAQPPHERVAEVSMEPQQHRGNPEQLAWNLGGEAAARRISSLPLLRQQLSMGSVDERFAATAPAGPTVATSSVAANMRSGSFCSSLSAAIQPGPNGQVVRRASLSAAFPLDFTAVQNLFTDHPAGTSVSSRTDGGSVDASARSPSAGVMVPPDAAAMHSNTCGDASDREDEYGEDEELKRFIDSCVDFIEAKDADEEPRRE